MNRRNLLAGALSTGLVPWACATPTMTEDEAPWAPYFSEANARGSMVVMDLRHKREARYVYSLARAQRCYSPASTFKVPHSLFALDAGLLRDEFQTIPWDGVQRSNAAWNQDQTLRSAMRDSTVWVYEQVASKLGNARETAYLQRLGYGNANTTGSKPFWVEGDLAVSSIEQLAFLRRLYSDELPFKVEHQRIVKDVMVTETGPDWTLRAKTGWTGRIGWWVGWVEWPDGPVFFVLNMDTPNRLADLAKRQDITRRILRSLDALP